MEVHQELKSQGFLTRWQDVPRDSEIVFISHEWLSWAHPDPEGNQLRVLCRVLERLKEGELDTEMDPLHTILYKHKFMTKGKDWTTILKRTYLWVDWFSMPQPGAEKEDKIGKKKMSVLRKEGSRAIQSIPAYVERSDFIMILVPPLYHSDRGVPTCYRTWRRRGWCLLELYATIMARDASNPPLLVRSQRGTPSWISPMEVMKLSIGHADFTCCQRNHVITTETQKIMNGGSVKKIPCDKPIAGGILEQLIDAKINHLLNMEGDLVKARLHTVLKQWWMRGLKEKEKFVSDQHGSSLQKFREKLRWNQNDDSWFDCGGVGLLMYAVVSDEANVVLELLKLLRIEFKGEEYSRRLESRIRDEGYITFGIPGRWTTLMAAMMSSSSDVVSMLLDYGANVESVDVMDSDAFMLASAVGRYENLQFWLSRVKDWNINRTDALFGGTPLNKALFIGANKLKTVKVLLNAGARLDYRTLTGSNILINTAENEDVQPEVIRFVLEKLRSSCTSEHFTSIVNFKRHTRSLKWKSIRFIATTLYRTGLAKSGLMRFLALHAGSTPLNFAVFRGDVEIVEILLKAGADPNIKNSLGMNAFEMCEKCGPFPSVMKVLKKYAGL